MALTKTTISPQGFEVLNAYHRVEGLHLIDKKTIAFRFHVYKDLSFNSFNEKAFSCSYDINGENPIKQAYLHIKTLPEFTDAVDC